MKDLVANFVTHQKLLQVYRIPGPWLQLVQLQDDSGIGIMVGGSEDRNREQEDLYRVWWLLRSAQGQHWYEEFYD